MKIWRRKFKFNLINHRRISEDKICIKIAFKNPKKKVIQKMIKKNQKFFKIVKKVLI